MPMYNLTEYSHNVSKTSGSLWQYYRDKPNGTLTNSESSKSKVKITGIFLADGNTKNVEIALPLKYLRNFSRTLEMLLSNCEITLVLTWSSACVIPDSTDGGTFAITDTKVYVSIVTLSTQDLKNSIIENRF